MSWAHSDRVGIPAVVPLATRVTSLLPTYEIRNSVPLTVNVAPSANPAKVPVTASAPSLLMIVNTCPAVGVKPRLTLSVAPPPLGASRSCGFQNGRYAELA